MNNSLVTLISGTGIINSLIASIFFWFSKYGNKRANKVLSVLLFVLIFKIGYAYILSFLEPYPHLIPLFKRFAATCFLSIGPLILMYSKTLIDKNFKANAVFYTHFIIPVIQLLFPFREIKGSFWVLIAFYFIYLVINTIYLVNSYKRLKKKNGFYDRFTLNKIRNIIIGSFVIWVTVISGYVYELTAIYSFVLYIVLFSALSHYSLKKRKIKNNNDIADSLELKSVSDILIKYIKDNKSYLNPEITLPVLAQSINVSTHILSKALNEKLKQNFTDFINKYRVEEAKSMLASSEKSSLKIATIAYDCGFNTLSTFNVAFKKFSNTTPKQYREQFRK